MQNKRQPRATMTGFAVTNRKFRYWRTGLARPQLRPSVSNRGAQNSRKQAKKKRKSRKAQGFPSHSGGCDIGSKMSHPHDWRDND